jgi:hypothetical protein
VQTFNAEINIVLGDEEEQIFKQNFFYMFRPDLLNHQDYDNQVRHKAFLTHAHLSLKVAPNNSSSWA